MIINPENILKERLNENSEESIEETIEYYMSGQCIPFTVALCKVFPQYQIAVINDEYESDDDYEDFGDDDDEDEEASTFDSINYNFVHAFCYLESDSRTIVDAKGIRPIKQVYDDFYDINPSIDWEIRSPDQLIKEYAGKEFYSEESFEYDKAEMERAYKFILANKSKYELK